MNKALNFQKFLNKFRWKARQKYSQLRCYLGQGYYIWQIEDGIRFISRKEDAFSHVLYVCQGHEKLEMKWCKNWIKSGNLGQSIIDCGANIGYFSAVLSQSCAIDKILAIEGNKHTAELCQQNIGLLEIKNITVIKAVLSDSSSENYFIPDIPGREPWQRAVKAEILSNKIRTTTLDEIVEQYKIHPNLVKIDCEGFETLILKGAHFLLNSIRPAFMIECNDNALNLAGTNRQELFSLLQKYNYKLFHLSSFQGRLPFGVELTFDFPSSEFNFAAIPNNQIDLKRWQNSIDYFNLYDY